MSPISVLRLSDIFALPPFLCPLFRLQATRMAKHNSLLSIRGEREESACVKIHLTVGRILPPKVSRLICAFEIYGKAVWSIGGMEKSESSTLTFFPTIHQYFPNSLHIWRDGENYPHSHLNLYPSTLCELRRINGIFRWRRQTHFSFNRDEE